ncbi:hypothetical protein BHE74_00023231 [Ensete ventricosum]|nr:hypothetical protein BHE74_00023231 [Ensete ventricosum]
MNSCTNKSRIISLYGFFILMQVLETKGASRHMHLISEKHLTEKLMRLNLRRRSWGQKALARGKRTRRRLLLKNMPQCWHSSCHEESAMLRPVVTQERSEHNRRWQRPYDVSAVATQGEIWIVVEQFEAIQHTREMSCDGLDHAKGDRISLYSRSG